MEEKETTQTEQAEVASQPDEVKAQPTVEELQGQLVERDKEIERKEGVLQTTKRELKDARQRGGSKAEIDALGSKLEDYQKFMAGALDEIYSRSSSDYEETKPVRKTYTQQLEERKPKTEEPKLDPDAQDFLSVCKAMDLHVDADSIDDCDPIVKEAMGEDRNFKQATKYLKEKMKPKEIDVDKVIDEKLQIRLEQELKNRGLTSEGVGAPSGSSVGFEKDEQDYVDGKIPYSEYKKLRQEQGIS